MILDGGGMRYEAIMMPLNFRSQSREWSIRTLLSTCLAMCERDDTAWTVYFHFLTELFFEKEEVLY